MTLTRLVALTLTLLSCTEVSTVEDTVQHLDVRPGHAGHTSLTLDVDQDGHARGHIPLELPRGRGTMAPVLALQYESTAGDSIVGHRWQLGGLSVLERCNDYRITTGATFGVAASAFGDLCLDGEPLDIATSTSAVTTYHTRRTFYRVTKESSQPFYVVDLGDGRRRFYGETPASRISAELKKGDFIDELWALTREEDTSGNAIVFEYEQLSGSTLDGRRWIDQRPTTIRYTVHPTHPVADRVISFTYAPEGQRPDRYHRGVLFRRAELLQQIRIAIDGGATLVRSYKLAYATDLRTGWSLLASVAECAHTAGATPVCRDPVRAGYYAYDAKRKSTTIASLAEMDDPIGVDLDGRPGDEIVYRRDGRLHVMRDVAGARTITDTGIPMAMPIFGSVDYDDDGRLDLLGWDGDSGKLAVYRATATGFDVVPLGIEAQRAIAADLNGDQRPEILAGSFFGTMWAFRRYDYAPNAYLAAGGTFFALSAAIPVTDHDGAGIAERLEYRGDCSVTPCRRYLEATGDGLATPAGPGNTDEYPGVDADGFPAWILADVNGDSLNDVVTGDLEVQLNTGRGLTASTRSYLPASAPFTPSLRQVQSAIVTDDNRDGLDDLLIPGDGADAHWWTLISDGSQFTFTDTGIRVLLDPDGRPLRPYYAIDFEGNGDLDRLIPNDASGSWIVQRNDPYAMWVGPAGMLRSLDASGDIVAGRARKSLHAAYLPLNALDDTDPRCRYPFDCVRDTRYVVAETMTLVGRASGHVDVHDRMSYRYADAREDLLGRGWIGLRFKERTNVTTGEIYRWYFDNQSYPYARRLLQEDVLTPLDGGRTRWRSTTLAHDRYMRTDGHLHPYLRTNTIREGESTDSSVLAPRPKVGEVFPGMFSEITTTYAVDAYGSVAHKEVSTLDGALLTWDYTRANDTARWLIGRIERVRRTSDLGTATTAITYDGASRIDTIITEPDVPSDRVDTKIVWSPVGLPTSVTRRAAGYPERPISITYDDRLLFPRTHTDAVGVRTFTFHPAHGTMTSLVDVNGATSTLAYDAFGRPVESAAADGTRSTTTASPPATTPSFEGEYHPWIALRDDAGGERHLYFDGYGRVIREETAAPLGRRTRVDVTYDDRGMVKRKSRPYFVGDPVLWIDLEHDNLGRKRAVTEPDGSTWTTSYDGLATTFDGPGVTLTRTVRDMLGRPVRDTDRSGRNVDKTWSSAGTLTRVRDGAGTTTTYQRDAYGRLTWVSDPSGGQRWYSYSPFGDLERLTDSRRTPWGGDSRYFYDGVGRLVVREDRLTSSSAPRVTKRVWDVAAGGRGQLAREESPDGVVTSFGYDTIGRLVRTDTRLDGLDYRAETTYGANGRPLVVSLPTRVGSPAVRIKYTYDRGEIAAITRADTGALLWRLDATTPAGQVTRETFGDASAATWMYDDASGLLASISETVTGGAFPLRLSAEEHYQYDPDRRLEWIRDATGTTTAHYEYDTLGQLQLASDVTGTREYDYDSLSRLSWRSDRGVYTYLPSRPHAPATIGGSTYSYDANGNRYAGGGVELAYDQLDRVNRITVGADTLNYRYDAGGNRVVARRVESGVSQTTRWFGALVETTRGGDVRQTLLVRGPRSAVAEIRRKIDPATGAASGERTLFRHIDRRGSTRWLTEAGRVVEEHVYRVDGDVFAITGADGSSAMGFTGHRATTLGGLVDMGGRFFDSANGVFTSADPKLPCAGRHQCLSSYGYAFNDPVQLVDPDGHHPDTRPRTDYDDVPLQQEPEALFKAVARVADPNRNDPRSPPPASQLVPDNFFDDVNNADEGRGSRTADRDPPPQDDPRRDPARTGSRVRSAEQGTKMSSLSGFAEGISPVRGGAAGVGIAPGAAMPGAGMNDPLTRRPFGRGLDFSPPYQGPLPELAMDPFDAAPGTVVYPGVIVLEQNLLLGSFDAMRALLPMTDQRGPDFHAHHINQSALFGAIPRGFGLTIGLPQGQHSGFHAFMNSYYASMRAAGYTHISVSQYNQAAVSAYRELQFSEPRTAAILGAMVTEQNFYGYDGDTMLPLPGTSPPMD